MRSPEKAGRTSAEKLGGATSAGGLISGALFRDWKSSLRRPYKDMRAGNSSVPTPSFHRRVRQHWRRKFECSAGEIIIYFPNRSGRYGNGVGGANGSAQKRVNRLRNTLRGPAIIVGAKLTDDTLSAFRQTARVL